MTGLVRGDSVFFRAQNREEAVFNTPAGQVKGHRHVNPDGSKGGWVPVDYQVPEGVYIDNRVSIWPGVTLPTGVTVIGPALITPNTHIIFG